jgi:hypothetical protein
MRPCRVKEAWSSGWKPQIGGPDLVERIVASPLPDMNPHRRDHCLQRWLQLLLVMVVCPHGHGRWLDERVGGA